MELNGGAERRRLGSGNDKRWLKADSGIRGIAIVKVDAADRSSLYQATDATLTGTLATLLTAVI